MELSRRYLWGPAVDQVLAQENYNPTSDATDALLWALTDNLGTVRDLVEYNAGTSTTSSVAHFALDSFGNVLSGDTSATRYLFTAQEFDEETGQYHYDARYYDPATATFISTDPIFDDHQNTYRYVGNGPTNATDPTGLFTMAGMYKAFEEKYGEEGQQLLQWATQTAGWSIQKQNYKAHDWYPEFEKGILGIKASQFLWNRSDANAAAQLNEALRYLKRVDDLQKKGVKGVQLSVNMTDTVQALERGKAAVDRNPWNVIGISEGNFLWMTGRAVVGVFEMVPTAVTGAYSDARVELKKHAANSTGLESAIAQAGFVMTYPAEASTEISLLITQGGMLAPVAAPISRVPAINNVLGNPLFQKTASATGTGLTGMNVAYGIAEGDLSVRDVVWFGAASLGTRLAFSGQSNAREGTGVADDLVIDAYGNLSRRTDLAGQAHHLNQTAVYRDVIPSSQGASIKLQGNILTDAGAPHTQAHASLESFWNQFRGTRVVPTNLQYTQGLQQSLRAAGLPESQVQQAVRAAIRERVQYGQLGGMPVPRVPAPIRNLAQ